MDFAHDVHDWLGGYPYESISAEAVERPMSEMGLIPERCFLRPPGLGLFGSGCNEYCYRKIDRVRSGGILKEANAF
jgi:2-polyprenyl-6-hydroxyphenyl methylase/3-demethylubiquinone-9 3-methyltransferase